MHLFWCQLRPIKVRLGAPRLDSLPEIRLLFLGFELCVCLLGEEHSDWFAMARNVDSLASFCRVNQAGQGVFGFSDRYLSHTVASFWLFL
jgi:hypothetical protein